MDTDNLKMQLRDIPIPSGLRERSRLGIRQATRERERRPLRRTMALAAAVLGLLLVSATIMNHARVWAAIQKALQFVPGIGVVEEDGSASSSRYVLKQPITLKVGGGTVVITGILSDEEMTYMTITSTGAPEFNQITIVNEQGDAFTLDRSIGSRKTMNGKITDWTASFSHKGELNIDGDIKLILQTHPAVEVSAHLDKAESYSSYSELGTTATANGLSITAIPDRVGEKGRVSLVTAPATDYRVNDYRIVQGLTRGSPKLQVVDAAGRKLPIESGITGPLSEFYFPLSDNPNERYSLTLPEISVRYASESTAVKVSTKAKEQMQMTFELAGFPVTITKAERLGNGKRLRLYLDMYFDEHAAASLYSFSIEGGSFGAKITPTGTFEYIDIDIDPDDSYMDMTFNRPEVTLRGPWTFEWSAEDFKAPQ